MSVEDDEGDKKRKEIEMRKTDRRILVMMAVMEWSGVGVGWRGQLTWR